MANERMGAVGELWELHKRAPFPSGLRGTSVSGVEMVMLDADVAGMVSSWLSTGGSIDDRRRDLLAQREQQLIRVLEGLTGDEATYYQRLLDMTVLVMTSPDGPSVDDLPTG
ncbi:hypothetical protein AB0M36_18375 [Actinoplanes sp. NPDC051346]|uniref:hypothetical protein n=1 Tax=Actinoplanes sp. NPDC051346 TaxID=3155048 RepID=UPI00343A2E57